MSKDFTQRLCHPSFIPIKSYYMTFELTDRLKDETDISPNVVQD